MTTDVDPATITHSGDLFGTARDSALKAANTALGILQGLAGMGGTDRTGHKWRTDYDDLARVNVASMQDTVNSLGRAAELLHATGVNHHNADTQSSLGKKPEPLKPPAPQPDVKFSSPPSAEGGDSGEPAWWHTIVSYLEGWTWPNGHQDQLLKAAGAWSDAAKGFRDAKRDLNGDVHSVGAIAPLMDQKSPEMTAVVDACNKASGALDTLANGCDVTSKMCSAFAQAITDAHDKIEHEMLVLGGTVVVTEVVAAILVPFTLGASEAASKVVDVARITATAERIKNIFSAFMAAAEASTFPALAGAANAVRFLGPELAELLSCRASIFGIEGVAAGERIAAEAAGRTGLKTAGKEIKGSEVFPGGKPYGNLTKEEWDKLYRNPDGSIRYPDENLPSKPYAKPGTPHNMTQDQLNALSGKVWDRLGHPGGGWLSPEGTSYGSRALPPDRLEAEYHAYTVHPEAGLPPGWKIEESIVEKTFGQTGGGTQYRILGPDGKTGNVQELIKRGFLVET